jgi:hypothetical protein
MVNLTQEQAALIDKFFPPDFTGCRLISTMGMVKLLERLIALEARVTALEPTRVICKKPETLEEHIKTHTDWLTHQGCQDCLRLQWFSSRFY